MNSPAEAGEVSTEVGARAARPARTGRPSRDEAAQLLQRRSGDADKPK